MPLCFKALSCSVLALIDSCDIEPLFFILFVRTIRSESFGLVPSFVVDNQTWRVLGGSLMVGSDFFFNDLLYCNQPGY